MSIEALAPPPEAWIDVDVARVREGDPHGCCRSCGYCAAALNVEYVRQMLAIAETVGLTPSSRQAARGSEWPGPTNLPVKVRRYVSLGLRDGFQCAYCATPLPIWMHTVDHVVPSSRGGSGEASNLVLACVSCNSSKGRRLPDEWMAA